MKTIIISILIAFLMIGCANRNPAYNEFEESPCACFEEYTKVKSNV